jgi:hypothetical protein
VKEDKQELGRVVLGLVVERRGGGGELLQTVVILQWQPPLNLAAQPPTVLGFAPATSQRADLVWSRYLSLLPLVKILRTRHLIKTL